MEDVPVRKDNKVMYMEGTFFFLNMHITWTNEGITFTTFYIYFLIFPTIKRTANSCTKTNDNYDSFLHFDRAVLSGFWFGFYALSQHSMTHPFYFYAPNPFHMWITRLWCSVRNCSLTLVTVSVASPGQTSVISPWPGPSLLLSCSLLKVHVVPWPLLK